MLDFKGLDHNSSIEEREVFYNNLVKSLPFYHVLIKTCDRVELYFQTNNKYFDKNRLFLITKHLFGLTSGIESPIIGECHILSQVKSAYENALKNETTSKLLNLLFQNALRVGKKVRTLTKISEGSPSHSLAAFNIVKNSFKDLSNIKIAIIGVNRINEELLKYFKKYETKQVYLGNRTIEKAKELGLKYGAAAFKLEEIKNVLKHTDVLIVATSAPHLLIKENDIDPHKRLMVIDLSSPKNVEKTISKMSNISYFDLQDVEMITLETTFNRLKEKEKAEDIVIEEADRFCKKIIS